jgi:hypothetical protein
MNNVALGFSTEPLLIKISQILPSRKLLDGLIHTRKYKQIAASIIEIGLIEPLSVAPPTSGCYLLLDGHIRLFALRMLGHDKLPCIIANDDESYTYNNRVNRISTIQEHVMLRRAIARGVTLERLAKALNMEIKSISLKSTLLDGICNEAAELLKHKQFSVNLCKILRRMKPVRQIECVELMMSADKVSPSYLQALLIATPPALLVGEKRTGKIASLSQEQISKFENEMGNLQGQYKQVEKTYGQDMLNLVLARSYLAKLLGNKQVKSFLQKNAAALLAEFEAVIQAVPVHS